MGDGDVGLVPVALATRVQGPALVLCGDEGLGRKIDVNRKLAGALPNAPACARGDGHVVDPAKLAPVVAEFLDMATGPMSAPVDR